MCACQYSIEMISISLTFLLLIAIMFIFVILQSHDDFAWVEKSGALIGAQLFAHNAVCLNKITQPLADTCMKCNAFRFFLFLFSKLKVKTESASHIEVESERQEQNKRKFCTWTDSGLCRRVNYVYLVDFATVKKTQRKNNDCWRIRRTNEQKREPRFLTATEWVTIEHGKFKRREKHQRRRRQFQKLLKELLRTYVMDVLEDGTWIHL